MKNPLKSLSFKIILTVLTGTIFSNLVIGIIVSNESSKALQQMMYEDLLHSVSAVAKDMNTNNQREIRMLQTLALDDELRNPDISLKEKNICRDMQHKRMRKRKKAERQGRKKM